MLEVGIACKSLPSSSRLPPRGPISSSLFTWRTPKAVKGLVYPHISKPIKSLGPRLHAGSISTTIPMSVSRELHPTTFPTSRSWRPMLEKKQDRFTTASRTILAGLPSFDSSLTRTGSPHPKRAYPVRPCSPNQTPCLTLTACPITTHQAPHTTRWMSRRVMPEAPSPSLHIPASPVADAHASPLAMDDGVPTPLHSGNTQLLPAAAGRRRSSAGGAGPRAQHIFRTQHDQYVSAFGRDVKRRSPFEFWPREALVDVLVRVCLMCMCS